MAGGRNLDWVGSSYFFFFSLGGVIDGHVWNILVALKGLTSSVDTKAEFLLRVRARVVAKSGAFQC